MSILSNHLGHVADINFSNDLFKSPKIKIQPTVFATSRSLYIRKYVLKQFSVIVSQYFYEFLIDVSHAKT